MAGNLTFNVEYRTGLLGRAALAFALLLARVRVRPPVRLVVWAVNRSSFIRIGNGGWRRFSPGLRTEGQQ